MKETTSKNNSIVFKRPRDIVLYDPCPPKELQQEYERMWKQLCDSSRRRLRREKL